jgi:hypothetical protein
MCQYYDVDRLLPLSIVALLLLLTSALMAYHSLYHNATGPLKAPKKIAPTSPSWKELQPGNLELADQFPEFCLQPQRHSGSGHLNIDTKLAASALQLQLQLQHQRPITPPDLWTPPRSPVDSAAVSRLASPVSAGAAKAEADPAVPLPFELLQRRPSLSLPRPRCASGPPQRSGRDKEETRSSITAARLQRSEKRSSSLGTKALSQSPTHSKLSSPPKPPPKPAKFSRQPRPAESQNLEAVSDLALIESQASATDDVLVDSSSIRGVHDQFLTRMTLSEQQRWITVQEKTFTKWYVSTCPNSGRFSTALCT